MADSSLSEILKKLGTPGDFAAGLAGYTIAFAADAYAWFGGIPTVDPLAAGAVGASAALALKKAIEAKLSNPRARLSALRTALDSDIRVEKRAVETEKRKARHVRARIAKQRIRALEVLKRQIEAALTDRSLSAVQVEALLDRAYLVRYGGVVQQVSPQLGAKTPPPTTEPNEPHSVLE